MRGVPAGCVTFATRAGKAFHRTVCQNFRERHHYGNLRLWCGPVDEKHVPVAVDKSNLIFSERGGRENLCHNRAQLGTARRFNVYLYDGTFVTPTSEQGRSTPITRT